MKILAILALVATIAGAGAVLYGINTLAPQVVQTAANVTEAQSVADTFDDMVTRLENGTFGGRIFGGTDDLRAEDCAFVTYTVRLQNKGFFPAEWISMELVEPKDGDVLALPDDSRHALAAGSVGDMQLTVLRRTDEEEQADTARTFKSILTANGRADADPIYNADGTVNMDASRRVVIKFRMKDSDMIDQMSAILEGSAQGE